MSNCIPIFEMKNSSMTSETFNDCSVLDVISFCAKQEIPLRDDESNQSLNKGNFLEMIEFLGKYDSNVTNRIENLPGNAKMLSIFKMINLHHLFSAYRACET